jgi:hypothetical protein
VAGVQLVPFIGAGRELVEFADLPGQAFAFALQVSWAARARRQGLLGLAPALPQLAERVGAMPA